MFFQMNASFLRLRLIKNLQCAKFSTKKQLPAHLVAFMENADMVVAWHPEPQIPYEYTKPLPVEKESPLESFLKVGEKETKEVFKQMKPEVVIEKLSEITYTTKHRWYLRPRDKRAKDTKPDRPYL